MNQSQLETEAYSSDGDVPRSAGPKLAERLSMAQHKAHTIKLTNPAVIGLFAAALGLIGNLSVAWVNNRNTRELNWAKMQADLIQQAVNTHDLQQSCRNLLFFIDTAFIADRHGKIKQQCLYPLPQTEIPFTGGASAASAVALPGGTVPGDMDIKVAKSVLPDVVRFQVAFTVPNEPNNPVFDTVKIYCTQLDDRERKQSKIYPEMQGNWKPGDRVSFTVDVPSKLANTQTGWNLTFCVGTDSACYPSPNLLKFVT